LQIIGAEKKIGCYLKRLKCGTTQRVKGAPDKKKMRGVEFKKGVGKGDHSRAPSLCRKKKKDHVNQEIFERPGLSC